MKRTFRMTGKTLHNFVNKNTKKNFFGNLTIGIYKILDLDLDKETISAEVIAEWGKKGIIYGLGKRKYKTSLNLTKHLQDFEYIEGK